ncbi:GNAT family acetyltransferase [Aspergillus avenaceus]|uniref:GNAT family acetyltransferase n=1 Tax=Aspergillus avenaceus TaxID=36643 RepID=A0A5N6TUS9_ASPAV|nr:GNAT family acetyltransferase [Aspergillus avenaceus]
MSQFKPFQSKRLAYRAVEPNAADYDFIKYLQTVSQSRANTSLTLLKPRPQNDPVDGYLNYLVKECLLAVIILRNDNDTATDTFSWIPIGVISLKGDSPECSHHRGGVLSVEIAPPYQNQGHGSEAIEWMLDWGFQKAGLHRISLQAFSYNEGAGRLYERLGFRMEGRQREAVWFDGAWHDMLFFGMLEGEWREEVAEWGGSSVVTQMPRIGLTAHKALQKPLPAGQAGSSVASSVFGAD